MDGSSCLFSTGPHLPLLFLGDAVRPPSTRPCKTGRQGRVPEILPGQPAPGLTGEGARDRQTRPTHSHQIQSSLHITPPLLWVWQKTGWTWIAHLPGLTPFLPQHTNWAGSDTPFSLTSPLPPPLTPGIGVTSVLGTRALGTRWCPPMVSFVSPSRYPLCAMLSSLPHLP